MSAPDDLEIPGMTGRLADERGRSQRQRQSAHAGRIIVGVVFGYVPVCGRAKAHHAGFELGADCRIDQINRQWAKITGAKSIGHASVAPLPGTSRRFGES